MDITNKKKKNINNKLLKEYFDYSNPDTIIKRLKDVSDDKNKNTVESINKKLNKIKKILENVPNDKPFKIEKNEKTIDIVEKIFELNREKQLGLGLKILTTNQVFSRLPITLAQLKAGIRSSIKSLKMKLDNYCILWTYQKNLQSNSIKV